MAQTRTITPAKLRKLAVADAVTRPIRLLGPRVHAGGAGLATPRRILVVETWGLGDVILATPFMAELRDRFPAARITLLAKPYAETVLAGSGLVDEIIYVDFPWTGHSRKYAPSRYDPGAFVRLFRELRARRFDLSFDARRDVRGNVVTYLSGATRRIGYDFGGGAHLLTDSLPSGDQQAHKIEDWMRLLEPVLGEVPAVRAPVLRVTRRERATAADTLRDLGLPSGAPVVAMHPGASHPIRRLREDIVAGVAERLIAEQRAGVLMVLDPEGHGSDFRLPSEVRVVRPPLRELMAILASVDALVCSDSAAMHIAVALGTPTTAIFGPQRPDWYGPADPRHRVVVEDVHCRPCFDACIYASPICMDRIETAQVWAALLSQLEAPD